MKPSFAAIAVIAGLAVVTWVFFYLLWPASPLRLPETTLVVCLWAAVVVAGKWIWTRLRRKGTKDEKER